ncbi:TPA: hypothetical protein EYO12_01795 [Candidatus Saccharibacteria bacterium]|nr:hypothetical protein [Candidatus Saccharibacteria bacterium]HIO87450.1 hypothetical protein [Candidatus Saccharibacteria bacterium]
MAEAEKTTQTNTQEAPVVVATMDAKKLKGVDAKGTVVPMPVARVYSSRGLEYLFMVLSLVGLTLGAVLLGNDIIAYLFDSNSVIGGLSEWAGLEALTIVSGLFFFYLWTRLRAAEEISPSLIADASRKRALQRGLIVGFISLLFASFAVVYILLSIASDGQDFKAENWQDIVTSIYTLGVIGASFNFLFNQERKGE